MAKTPKTIALCDCLGTQSVDPQLLSQVTGLPCTRVHTGLCTRELDVAAKLIEGSETIIACGQEGERFASLADELGADTPPTVDLRDRAGWSEQGTDAGPKMAALLAEALLPMPAEKSIDLMSEGQCLVIGPGAVAFAAAEDLAPHLAVTVLVTDDEDAPVTRAYDIIKGRLKSATGSFTRFEIRIDAFQQVDPGGRGSVTFTPPADGARSACDVILDLSGNPPLFPAPEKREGYLRADPGSPGAVGKAVLAASHLTGTFEQPLYVQLERSLCAHSRAGQTGCTNCLDICPTGALSPDGDHVAVDPMICAGCGACSAVCPSGAIAYDAPPVATIFRRVETLARGFRDAGGKSPRLLVTDTDHGPEMIRLAARYGRGLPADAIPMTVAALNAFGHAEMLAALACGFADVSLLLAPRTEREAIEREAALARAVAGEPSVRILDLGDPDALSDLLYGTEAPKAHDTPILPMGTRRQITRLAAQALAPETETITLPDTAPYGAVLVDTDACTLCLSCVSLCPSGALGDNPDLPQLRFQEDACLQCGLCENVCPENAITLEPRLNLTDTALEQTVLHEEEPFACVECGTLFGVKSTIEKITEKLAGKHSMFGSPDAARMIQMCDNCRVQAQFHSQNNPFTGGERPQVRTTEDYFSKRKDH